MPTTRSKKAFDYNLIAPDVRKPLRAAVKKTGLPEETVIGLCVQRFLESENADPKPEEWTVLAVAEDAIDWAVPIALIVDHVGLPHLVEGARGVCSGVTIEQLEGWLKTGQQPLSDTGHRVTRELTRRPTDWNEAIDWCDRESLEQLRALSEVQREIVAKEFERLAQMARSIDADPSRYAWPLISRFPTPPGSQLN